MPIYEFHCNPCDIDFEELVIGSNTDVKCPKCMGSDVVKILSVFAFKSGNVFSSSASTSCGTCSSSSCSSCK